MAFIIAFHSHWIYSDYRHADCQRANVPTILFSFLFSLSIFLCSLFRCNRDSNVVVLNNTWYSFSILTLSLVAHFFFIYYSTCIMYSNSTNRPTEWFILFHKPKLFTFVAHGGVLSRDYWLERRWEMTALISEWMGKTKSKT